MRRRAAASGSAMNSKSPNTNIDLSDSCLRLGVRKLRPETMVFKSLIPFVLLFLGLLLDDLLLLRLELGGHLFFLLFHFAAFFSSSSFSSVAFFAFDLSSATFFSTRSFISAAFFLPALSSQQPFSVPTPSLWRPYLLLPASGLKKSPQSVGMGGGGDRPTGGDGRLFEGRRFEG